MAEAGAGMAGGGRATRIQKRQMATNDGESMGVWASGLGCFVIFVFFCGLAELRKTEQPRLHPMKTREPGVS